MDDIDLALLIFLEDEDSEEDVRRESELELFKKRTEEGTYNILVCRHLQCNENKFREYFRPTPPLFDYILSYIKDDITSKPLNRIPNPLPPEHKFCLFLRFLATGESFRSLAFQFRISHSWISFIVKQVANSIVNRMLNLIIPQPTEALLRMVSNKFMSVCNFPNCVGAIDGKHVRIKAPKNSGYFFFNYKEFYSIVLLAIVDADNKFIAVDIGSYGREGDAGIYLKSKFGKQIYNNTFCFPSAQSLPGMDIVVPHVLVGDEAFALQEHLLKPYPRSQSVINKSKAIYNYRLSRARRNAETSFGILCAYFRIFFQPIATAPETTDKLITCACILHNILRDAKVPPPIQVNDNEKLPLPTNNLIPLQENNVRAANLPTKTREIFKSYFNGPGAVEWQDKYYRQH